MRRFALSSLAVTRRRPLVLTQRITTCVRMAAPAWRFQVGGRRQRLLRAGQARVGRVRPKRRTARPCRLEHHTGTAPHRSGTVR